MWKCWILLNEYMRPSQQQFMLVGLITFSVTSGLWLLAHSQNQNITEESNVLYVNLILEHVQPRTEGNERKKPLLLFWTGYYERNAMEMEFFIRKTNWKPSCCTQLETSSNRSRLHEATVVVFYHWNLFESDLPKTKRLHDQLWVFFYKEALPMMGGRNLSAFNNLFNLTMGFRRDSDIWAPYGQKVELEESVRLRPSDPIKIKNVTLETLIASRRKLLFAVISHCKTHGKREILLKKLLSELPVDVYGNCGKKVCHRLSPNCSIWRNLTTEYKFVFAGENALCVDYITEKFWRGLDLGLVPVVYGGGDYAYEAPPNSYINLEDFGSPAEFGEFVKELDMDEVAYRKFFEWRREYAVKVTDAWHGFCLLCELIEDYAKARAQGESDPYPLPKFYPDLNSWWRKTTITTKGQSDTTIGEACQKPTLWN